MVTAGGYRRDFVSGELGELDSILSNRGAPSVYEDPGVCFWRVPVRGTGLRQIQGPGTVKGLKSCVQSTKGLVISPTSSRDT